MSGSAARVALRGVSKHYGGVQAVREVDLDIAGGQVHSLIGENGAGKSTAAKMVGGLVRPDRGAVLVDGSAVRLSSPRDALRHGIAMIGQEPSVVPTRTVLQNVLLGAEPHRAGLLTRTASRRRFEAITERTGLWVDPDVVAASLRVADQQKVEILRAMGRDARVLVMDEPTAALGREDSAALLELIGVLRARGVSIIFVSHRLEEVLGVSDAVTVMRDGEVVRRCDPEEETPDSLTAAMVGRDLAIAFPERPPVPEDAPVVCRVERLSRPPAVRDVSFTVRAGEIVVLAGLVGSGRTETVRALFGADRAASGAVWVGGERIVPGGIRRAMAGGVGMIPENRTTQGLLMYRPVMENMSLAARQRINRYGFLLRRRERELVAGLQERLDIRPRRPGMPAYQLSGGNQQKVLFGRWLARDPRVLIADEPTRGIDVAAKQAVHGLLASLARGGTGIIVVSSELEDVVHLAHRVLVFRAGTIVATLTGPEITEESVTRASFGLTKEASA